jgi:hypothetical protein
MRHIETGYFRAAMKRWFGRDISGIDKPPFVDNNESITAINAANTGEVALIKATASDLVELGTLDDTYLGYQKSLSSRDAAGTGSYALIRLSADGVVSLPNPTTATEDFTMAALKKLVLSAAGFTMASIARTATADGTTTGTIASGPMLQHVTVTCDDANKIIVLPTPTPGVMVVLSNGATGYELRTSTPGSIGINGGTGVNAESAIGANTTVLAICATATSWKALQLGADGTLAKVEVAAP